MKEWGNARWNSRKAQNNPYGNRGERELRSKRHSCWSSKFNWYVVKISKKGFPAGASTRENPFELCRNLRGETTGISGHGKLISGMENRLFRKNYKYQCVVVTRLRVQN